MMYIRRQICTDTTLKAILLSHLLATSDVGRHVVNVKVSLADQPVKSDKQYKLIVVLYLYLCTAVVTNCDFEMRICDEVQSQTRSMVKYRFPKCIVLSHL